MARRRGRASVSCDGVATKSARSDPWTEESSDDVSHRSLIRRVEARALRSGVTETRAHHLHADRENDQRADDAANPAGRDGLTDASSEQHLAHEAAEERADDAENRGRDPAHLLITGKESASDESNDQTENEKEQNRHDGSSSCAFAGPLNHFGD